MAVGFFFEELDLVGVALMVLNAEWMMTRWLLFSWCFLVVGLVFFLVYDDACLCLMGLKNICW